MQPVHAIDKIVVHGQCKRVQLAGIIAVDGSLDIGVAERISDLRTQTALHGSAADKGSKNDDADPVLPERGIQGALIVDISVSHHLQQSPLRQIYLCAVTRFGRLHRLGTAAALRLKQNRYIKLLPGQRVVNHHYITCEKRVRHDGHIRKASNQIGCPCGVVRCGSS